MPFTVSVAGHVAVGSVAMLLYWVALLSVKGSPRHRSRGKVFFVTLVVVAFSVGPLLLLRPGEFDPAYVVQFVYLDLCLITVALIGWTAIRWKTDVDSFRGRHFRVLGPTIFVLGLVVLLAGVASRDPLPMIFSWVGLVYGGAMIRFAWMRAEPHPRWWLCWHLNAVCGLFNAVHGTFLAVAWRNLVDPEAGDAVMVATQLGTMAVALTMRIGFGRLMNAPLRLSRTASTTAPQVVAGRSSV